MAAQQYLSTAEFQAQTLNGAALAGINDTDQATALTWASGVAASYLRKRYALPLVSWGEELKQKVGELAQWFLLTRRGFKPNSGSDEVARLRYEDAISWFKDVSRGLVEIDCVDQTPTVDEAGSLAASEPRSNWSITTGRRCDTSDSDGD